MVLLTPKGSHDTDPFSEIDISVIKAGSISADKIAPPALGIVSKSANTSGYYYDRCDTGELSDDFLSTSERWSEEPEPGFVPVICSHCETTYDPKTTGLCIDGCGAPLPLKNEERVAPGEAVFEIYRKPDRSFPSFPSMWDDVVSVISGLFDGLVLR